MIVKNILRRTIINNIPAPEHPIPIECQDGYYAELEATINNYNKPSKVYEVIKNKHGWYELKYDDSHDYPLTIEEVLQIIGEIYGFEVNFEDNEE